MMEEHNRQWQYDNCFALIHMHNDDDEEVYFVAKGIHSLYDAASFYYHHLLDMKDEYDMDFFKAADVLFLSNEDIKGEERDFISRLANLYKNLDVIVVGMGADGAMLYHRSADNVKHLPAVKPSKIVNTIGAGDALLSAFTHFRFTRKLSAEESLTMAQKFASIKIGVSGAANGFVTEAELC